LRDRLLPTLLDRAHQTPVHRVPALRLGGRRPGWPMRIGARGASLLVSSVAVAVPLVTGPAASGSPVLKGFLPPKPVSACGTLAGGGSFYFLTANLGPVTGNCLVVTAPHVTLNLEGHTITGVWTKSTSGLPGVPISFYEIGILIEPKAVGTKVQSTVP